MMLKTVIPGEVFATATRQLLGSAIFRRPRLHVRFGENRCDGTIKFFEAHGDARKVIDAKSQHGREQQGRNS